MNKRNIGFFKVSVENVKEKPDEVAAVFSMLKVLPYWVNCHLDLGEFEYHAMCDQFEIVEIGFMAPEYQLIMKSEGGKIVSAEFKKRKSRPQ